MKKFIFPILASVCLSAASAGHKDPNGTIRGIERQRNAKCDYVRSSSFGRSFGAYKWHNQYYHCVGNAGDFRVSLRVRKEVTSYNDRAYGGGSLGIGGMSVPATYGNPKVTSVSFY